jgi:hypothetical protein
LRKDQTIIEVNKPFLEKFGSAGTTLRKLSEINGGQWNIPAVKNLFDSLSSQNNIVRDYKAKIGENELVLNAGLIKLPDKQEDLILIAVRENVD